MLLSAFLSGENIALAKQEIVMLLEPLQQSPFGRVFIFDISEDKTDLLPRLAFTRSVSRVLFSCIPEELAAHFESYDWNMAVHGSFRVQAPEGLKFPAKDFAKYVYRKLINPKVDLKHPQYTVVIHPSESAVTVGIEIWSQQEKFASRKAHKRAGFLPSSMHPKLARAMVNLSGCVKGRITDPFCGSGGILIEAGMMGLSAKGHDISEKAIDAVKKNSVQFMLKGIEIEKKDALLSKDKWEYVVTDLPYGKVTLLKPYGQELYPKFFEKLGKQLEKVAVVSYPLGLDAEKMLPKNLNILSEFKIYIHKSMTKKIIVLSKT